MRKSAGKLTRKLDPFYRVTSKSMLQLLDSGLIQDVSEHRDFLGDAGPGVIGALRPYLETSLEQLLFHFRRSEHLHRRFEAFVTASELVEFSRERSLLTYQFGSQPSLSW